MRPDRKRWVVWAWALTFPAFWLLGLTYAANVWCLPPDPDGALLRDAEMCHGDDVVLLVGIAQIMLVWLGGLLWLIWWRRTDRR